MGKITPIEAKQRLQNNTVNTTYGRRKVKTGSESEEVFGSGNENEIEYIQSLGKEDSIFMFKSGDSYILSPADDELDPIIGEFDEISEDGTMPPCLIDWLNECDAEIESFQTFGLKNNFDEPSYGISETNIQLVDLGLSVKWANMNIGASKPEDVGNYYAWGETEIKTDYTIAKYKYYDATSKTYKDIGKSITNTEYDVAHKIDNKLCMPTMAQAKELFTKCTWTKTKLNNINGWEVKGPNGNTIFIPINGCKSESSKVSYTSYVYFWTSDATSNAHQANTAKITDTGTIYGMYKRTGVAIRAVESIVETKPKIKMVDLGLSVNWADMNLGASTPEEYGDYYSWAELETKDNYTWDTYKYYVKVPAEYINIGKDIQKSSYDQAYALSKTLCIPTEAQWKELQSKCKFTEKTVDDVKGYEVTGTNGNSIFIPFGGNSYDGKTGDVNVNGYYHSSTLTSTNYQFKTAKFGVNNAKSIVDLQRRTGSSIRPIASGEAAASDEKTLNIKFVDLGLSVKWANMNLGATKPSDKGDYYAWGDLEANKKSFTWAAYKHYKAQIDQSQDLGVTITQNPKYDVAFVKDNTMCIPRASHWEELMKKCTWTETTKNGIKGYEVKGPNGNTIFLPNAGYKLDKKVSYLGTQGIYTTACYYSTNISQYRRTCDWKTGGKPAIAGTRKRAGTPIRPISVAVNNVKKSIDPLIPYKWSQSAPYNNLLPKDPSTGKTVVTGCSNTALAMIMAYWGCLEHNKKKYRRGCEKTASYVSKKGTKYELTIPSLDPIVVFDYDNLNKNTTTELNKTAASKNAVATLMKYIGHASAANYSSGGTGTSVTNTLNAIKGKLRLSSTAKLVYASSGAQAWEDKIYENLAKGWPVWVAGWSDDGKSGHAFICDGYDAITNKFHFNWGWSGSYNGWFSGSSLTPGTSSYTNSRRAILDICPTYVLGDTDNDGEISVSDLMNIVSDILNKKNNKQSDINADGTVTVEDLQFIIDIILGNKTL